MYGVHSTRGPSDGLSCAVGEGGILAVPASLLFLSLNICGRNPGTGMNLKLVSFLLDYFYFFKAQVDPLLWFVK